ncbi:MAG: hypothetical protein NTY19_41350 [Planctomycetota bacterium]|nr:hypothetical protein [Planctomycetota bacterium]
MNQHALSFVLSMLQGLLAGALLAAPATPLPEIPDAEIDAAYERAAVQNVLAAVNPKVFPGYPANLIRIVQRFLFGVDPRLDGSLVLMPTATAAFWEHGFGQTLVGGHRKLSYRMQRNRIAGTYQGTAPLRLGLRFPADRVPIPERALINGRSAEMVREKDLVFLSLPAASPQDPCRFAVACGPAPNSAADQDHNRQHGERPGQPARSQRERVRRPHAMVEAQ